MISFFLFIKLNNLIMWFYVDLCKSCKHFLVFMFCPNLSLISVSCKNIINTLKSYITKSGREDLSDLYVKHGCYCNCVLKNETSIRKSRRMDNRIFVQLLDQQCYSEDWSSWTVRPSWKFWHQWNSRSYWSQG